MSSEKHDIVQAYDHMNEGHKEHQLFAVESHEGLTTFSKYPPAYQASNLAHLAGEGGTVTLRGNNMAFYLDTARDEGRMNNLKGLIREALANKVESVTIQIDHRLLDAEKMEDYVHSYYHARPEVDDAMKRQKLGEEATRIRAFVLNPELLKEKIADVLRENLKAGESLNAGALELAARKIRIQPIEVTEVNPQTTKTALTGATWIVTGTRPLVGYQDLLPNTEDVKRPWVLGNPEKLQALAEAHDKQHPATRNIARELQQRAAAMGEAKIVPIHQRQI